MRKNRIICFMLVLSLLLSSSALALGTDYTLTPTWFYSVLRNSQVTRVLSNGDRVSSYIRSGDFEITSKYVMGDGMILGSLPEINDTSHLLSFVNAYHYDQNASAKKSLYIRSPFNVTVAPNETLNFQIMLFLVDSYSGDDIYQEYDTESSLSMTFSDGTGVNLSSYFKKNYYSYAELGGVNRDYNGNVTGFTSEVQGEAVQLIVSWKNTLGHEVTVNNVDFYTLYNGTNYFYKYYYGFLTESGVETVLPDYVEENLANISHQLEIHTEQNYAVLEELAQIRIQLDALKEAMSSGSNTTNNYYQTITTPSESQTSKDEELNNLVTEAKKELEEMKEVIESVKTPTFEDISSATTSASTQVSIDNSLSNSTINGVLGKLFENTTLVTMMLSCISIATVGYILYGKR